MANKLHKSNKYSTIQRVTWVGVAINLGLAVSKTWMGLWGRSPALFSDGIHSFSDLISDFMVLIAAHYAGGERDENHPYGHQRFETLATVILSVFLVMMGAGIFIHAMENIFYPSSLLPSYWTLWVAIISIVANEFLCRYTLFFAKKINSDLLKANAYHARADSLSSLIVVIGLIATFLGWHFMDAIAAMIVAGMVIKIGVQWGYKSISELVDTGLEPEVLEEVNTLLKQAEGVKSIHNLRTRKMAGEIYLDVHVVVDPEITVSEGHYISESLEQKLLLEVKDMKDVTIHIDIHEVAIENLEMLMPNRKAVESLLTPLLNEVHLTKHVDKIDLHYQCELGKIKVILHSSSSITLCISNKISTRKLRVIFNVKHN